MILIHLRWYDIINILLTYNIPHHQDGCVRFFFCAENMEKKIIHNKNVYWKYNNSWHFIVGIYIFRYTRMAFSIFFLFNTLTLCAVYTLEFRNRVNICFTCLALVNYQNWVLYRGTTIITSMALIWKNYMYVYLSY